MNQEDVARKLRDSLTWVEEQDGSYASDVSSVGHAMAVFTITLLGGAEHYVVTVTDDMPKGPMAEASAAS